MALTALFVVACPVAVAFLHFIQHPFDVSEMSAFMRGALAGTIMIVLLSGGAWTIVVLTHWTLGRTVEMPHWGSVVLEKGLVLSFGALLFGTVISVTEGIQAAGAILLFLGAFYIALFVGTTLLAPWFVLALTPRLTSSSEHAHLQAWFDDFMSRYDKTPVPVRVQDGTVYNAYVLWKPGRPFLVVGRPLLHHLSESELRAILAHEAAHLVRRDTVILVWVGLVAALVAAPVMQFVAWPLMTGGHPIAGAALFGLFNGGLLMFIGAHMRRMEFRTDRLAVSMMQNRWEPLASALEKLAKFKRMPLDRTTLTHPSVSDRIARMRLTCGQVGKEDPVV